MIINLQTYLSLIDYKIVDGGDWYANIPNLFHLSSWNDKHDGWSSNVVFSTEDQRVMVAEVCDYGRNLAYCMRDSDLDFSDTAWDDVKFVELSSVADFVEAVLDIKRHHA